MLATITFRRKKWGDQYGIVVVRVEQYSDQYLKVDKYMYRIHSVSGKLVQGMSHNEVLALVRKTRRTVTLKVDLEDVKPEPKSEPVQPSEPKSEFVQPVQSIVPELKEAVAMAAAPPAYSQDGVRVWAPSPDSPFPIVVVQRPDGSVKILAHGAIKVYE